MMTRVLFFLVFFTSSLVFSQKDSLKIGDKYWEDQLYLDISYNVLTKQPSTIPSSTFSYGISAGYIKDIPFNRAGRFALGLGLGYNYDSFNHSLKVLKTNTNVVFSAANNPTSNTLNLHNIEFPIQLRWRTSTATTYSFWRIYTGLKVTYNLSHNFTNVESGVTTSTSSISNYNKWQMAATLSAGYSTFNFYVSYGLTPLFNNAVVGSETLNTSILKLGISFYFL
ncbi:hypothetical protein WH52_02755 [Tenacibaculum holothuriorum]|uniref:Outer membrane protein beta-barrel domain-containing protein n=1 Tax=Tenacibaculum holothuriorum TaxID=1635173 RepID=A0A1Y2PFN5_9FLAO|nr:porin family protein [Tenacibaculum holothuriorum]OSY88617.1 hypothetical protein WH52_02755 [Tenacibaculum holothuriorum]